MHASVLSCARVAAARGLAALPPVLLAIALCACRDAPPVEKSEADAESERIAQLSALAYLGSVAEERRAESRGVVVLDRERTQPGITAFGGRHGPPAGYFFDREGRELGRYSTQPDRGNSLLWMEPTRDGQLLVSGRGFVAKTTWAGEILWQAEPRQYHHGFDQAPDGRVFAMAHELRAVDFAGREITISDDLVVELSSAGATLGTISILDLLGAAAIPRRMLELAAAAADGSAASGAELEGELAVDHPWDVFHLNSVEVLTRDLAVARRGDLLVSLRTLNLVLVIGLDPVGVRWQWGKGRKLLDRPHAPRALANGNLLVFDNGWRRGYSRLVEVEPRSRRIVWQYVAEPPESFYTRRGGVAQPLANGNLLVTESDSGRLFEITRGGEIVWEFWSPIFEPAKAGEAPKRKTIYRAWRWSAEELRPAALPKALRRALPAHG